MGYLVAAVLALILVAIFCVVNAKATVPVWLFFGNPEVSVTGLILSSFLLGGIGGALLMLVQQRRTVRRLRESERLVRQLRSQVGSGEAGRGEGI